MADKVSLIDAEIRACRSKLEALGGGEGILLRSTATPAPASIVADAHNHTVKVADGSIVKIIWKHVISEEEKEVQFKNITTSQNFIDWCSYLDAKLLKTVVFKTIIIHSVDMVGPKMLFLKFSTDMVYNPEFTQNFTADKEVKTPPNINSIVFLRGGSVAILMVLNCEDGKQYSIVTQQTRIPIGKMCMEEIPAGMLDGSSNFGGVAAKEIMEETKIRIHLLELENLLKPGDDTHSCVTYPSPGGCDETMRFFLFEPSKIFTLEEIQKMHGREAGALEEGEVITVKVVTLDQLRDNIADMKTMTALYLFDRYKAKFWADKALDASIKQKKKDDVKKIAQARMDEIDKELKILNPALIKDKNRQEYLSKEWLAQQKLTL